MYYACYISDIRHARSNSPQTVAIKPFDELVFSNNMFINIISIAYGFNTIYIKYVYMSDS